MRPAGAGDIIGVRLSIIIIELPGRGESGSAAFLRAGVLDLSFPRGTKRVGDVERYAHLASDHLAIADSRIDSLLGGYDLATPETNKGLAITPTP